MVTDEKKYTYRIEWSEADQAHVARCLEFPSLGAHGNTPQEALKQIEIVVAESIRWMIEEGENVPEPLGSKHVKGAIEEDVLLEVTTNDQKVQKRSV